MFCFVAYVKFHFFWTGQIRADVNNMLDCYCSLIFQVELLVTGLRYAVKYQQLFHLCSLLSFSDFVLTWLYLLLSFHLELLFFLMSTCLILQRLVCYHINFLKILVAKLDSKFYNVIIFVTVEDLSGDVKQQIWWLFYFFEGLV